MLVVKVYCKEIEISRRGTTTQDENTYARAAGPQRLCRKICEFVFQLIKTGAVCRMQFTGRLHSSSSVHPSIHTIIHSRWSCRQRRARPGPHDNILTALAPRQDSALPWPARGKATLLASSCRFIQSRRKSHSRSSAVLAEFLLSSLSPLCIIRVMGLGSL